MPKIDCEKLSKLMESRFTQPPCNDGTCDICLITRSLEGVDKLISRLMINVAEQSGSVVEFGIEMFVCAFIFGYEYRDLEELERLVKAE